VKRVCREQNKKLLKSKTEVELFINMFPGETINDKIWNFIVLFNLKDAFSAYYEKDGMCWSYSLGNQRFSEIDENNYVYGVYWENNCGHSFDAMINGHNENICAPYIVHEDI
jgi:hypothetical protein